MAKIFSSVNVIEQCKISPPSGSVPPTSLPLTVFDIHWLPFSPVQRLIFYEFLHSKAYFIETILPNIKHSLSLALQCFFPLAGNLAWPHSSAKPEFQYIDGNFVLLTVAESDNNFFALVDSSNPRVVSAYHPLSPNLPVTSADELVRPLVALQITLFPNQGICIGITYSHLGFDGKTLHHFIKSWASICKLQGETTSPVPYYDRSVVNKNPSWVDTVCLNFMRKVNFTRETFHISKVDDRDIQHDKVMSTFVMTPQAIKRLRQWVTSRLDNETLHFSAFVLTCAYVWVCLIKSGWGGDGEDAYFVFVVDCRGRLDPPVPSTYFGNCIIPILLTTKRSCLLGNDGMLIAAQLIGSAIQTIENGDAVLKGLENFLSADFSFSPDNVLSVAGATKFGIYDTDFGWGKPKKSEVLSIAGSGAISLCDSPSEIGAVEVGLVRSITEMEAFASSFADTIQGFSC